MVSPAAKTAYTGFRFRTFISSYSSAYYFTLIVAAVCFLIIHRMLKAPFGSALQGIRDNPIRSSMIGVNVRIHQLVALVIAGFFAGVAGVLFVVVDSSVFPDMLFWSLSMELCIMCLLGGWLTFFGPLVGAGTIVLVRTFVSTYTDILVPHSRDHSHVRHLFSAGGDTGLHQSEVSTNTN